MSASSATVAADIDLPLLQSYAADVGWRLGADAPGKPGSKKRREALAEALAKCSPETREAIAQDFERLEQLCQDRSGVVLRDAFGRDNAETYEALKSERSRAMWLFHNHPDRFDMAEEQLTYVLNIARRCWRGYNLGKSFSRSWTSDDTTRDAVETIIARTVSDMEQAKRKVEVEWIVHPETIDGWEGALGYLCLIHIADRDTTIPGWKDGQRGEYPHTPDRCIQLMVSPSAKTVDAVGKTHVTTEVLEAVLQVFASEVLKVTEALVPFKARNYVLEGLETRPPFPTHDEHGISEVKVTKLVIGRRPGTVTYWAPARAKEDAYDVFYRSPGRKKVLRGREIRAASFRVVFEAQKGRRKPTVSFEITLPNKSTLPEEGRLQRIIIGTYLADWGLCEPTGEEAGDPGSR